LVGHKKSVLENLIANTANLDNMENKINVNEYIKEKVYAEIEKEMSPMRSTKYNPNISSTKLQSFKKLDLKLVDTLGNLNNPNFNIEIDR